MINEFSDIKVIIKQKKNQNVVWTFTTKGFDIGDFFDKFFIYFDNYDDIYISFEKLPNNNNSSQIWNNIL